MLKAKFYINSSPKVIINNIKYPTQAKLWNIGVRNHRLLNNNDSTWIVYTIQNIPHPFPPTRFGYEI